MFSEYANIQFTSGPNILRGRLYAAHKRASAPCVIMAHGTSATISMALEDYAVEFQGAGLNVIIYDHAGLGDSDGVERQVINPWIQAKGFRDAFLYTQNLTEHHNGQIFLWGDSYAAMLVLVVGAFIEGLTGIVSHIPATGITHLQSTTLEADFNKLKTIFEADDLSNFEKEVIGPLPVVSADQLNTPSLLQPIQAFLWFITHGGRFGSNWQNLISRVTVKTPVPFAPQITAPFIKVPTMMLVGSNDEMIHCNPEVQKSVFDAIRAPKEFHEVDGGHFGCLYAGSSLFKQAVHLEIEFMKRNSHII
jgi:hypothetical protein